MAIVRRTSELTPSKVFVPGGMPVITYVPRAERELEARLRSVEDNLCKLVTLTGATKSGKTVLANRIFPRVEGTAIWIDGGSIDSEETFWREVHAHIDEDEELARETSGSSTSTVSGEIEGEGGVPLLAKARGKGALARADADGKSRQTKPVSGIKARTIRLLRESGRPLMSMIFTTLSGRRKGRWFGR